VATIGGDGKTYKVPARTDAGTPAKWPGAAPLNMHMNIVATATAPGAQNSTSPSIDGLISLELAVFARKAQREKSVAELAAALKRYAAKLAGSAAVTVPEVLPVVAEPVVASAPVPDGTPRQQPAPPKPLRDVRRDIMPAAHNAADNADYGDPPVEGSATEKPISASEPTAQVEDLGATEKPISVSEDEPEFLLEIGKIVHLHQATQCGRIRVPDGDLNFDGRIRLEPGLVLRQGMEVDCRLLERSPGWVQVLEMAKVQAEA
jgi:hypothetical protein